MKGKRINENVEKKRRSEKRKRRKKKKKNSKSRIGVNQRKTETVSERRNRSSSYNLLHVFHCVTYT